MKKLLKILAFIILVTTQNLNAQDLSNLRRKFYVSVSDTVLLDSLAIVPGSVKVFSKGQPVVSGFSVVWEKALFVPHRRLDSALIIYRVFDFGFYQGGKNPQIITVHRFTRIEDENVPRLDFNVENSLQADGRISRGVLLGTATEPGVSSDFNLRLSGKLSEDISIEAVIADNSFNDYRFEGTYGLRDFDRTRINILFPGARLSAGDIRTRYHSGDFVRYDRAIKGMMYVSRDSTKQIITGLGIQKGFFNRQKITPQDGNQGPYRLKGINGEEFIVVIAGSERVFIDGKLLKRGADKDYVIDYNRGEITFMPRRPVTRDSRIIVEFEYWITGYLRSSTFAYYSKKLGKNTVYSGYLRTGDNIAAASQTLTPEQIALLASIGDTVDRAIWFSADSTGISDEALYCRTDTTIDGQTYRIFSYNPGAPCAVWKVTFSYAGKDKGEYILLPNSENNRAFRWVGPGKGDYMPVIKLPVPSRQSILNAGGNFKLPQGWSLSLDLAAGNRDENLFSPYDDNDNSTANFSISLSKTFKKSANSPDSTFFSAGYKLMNENFPVFDRYLPVEFERDWNLGNIPGNMHLASVRTVFYKKNTETGATGQMLVIPGVYQGYKTDLSYRLKNKKWNITVRASANISKKNGNTANFLRTKQSWIRKFKRVQTGMTFEAERNKIVAGSLQPNSFAFMQTTFFIQSGDTSKSFSRLRYIVRQNFYPVADNLQKGYVSYAISADWSKNSDKLQQSFNLTYRKTVTDTSSGQTLLLQSRTNLRASRSALLSLLVQSQNGMQPVTEFHFIKVPAGTGQYAWIDFNGDGIQQINEFQLTRFPDQAQYIRITLPSPTYIPVIANRAQLNLNFKPQKLPGKLAGKISNDLTLFFNQKNKLHFISLNPNDTNTVLYDLRLVNRTALNVTKKIHLLLTLNRQTNKNLLSGGFQSSSLASQQISVKYTPNIKNNLIFSVENGQKSFQSQLFLQSNYAYSYKSAEFEYLNGLGINTIELEAKLENKTTDSLGNIPSISLRTTFSRSIRQKLRINLTGIYLYNAAPNPGNPELTYILFQGYAPGNNLNLNISGNYNILPKLTLNINYNLRLIQNRTAHNISFQITGLF